MGDQSLLPMQVSLRLLIPERKAPTSCPCVLSSWATPDQRSWPRSEGSSLWWRALPFTWWDWQLISLLSNVQPKIGRQERKGSKEQDDRLDPDHINNHIKYKWSKDSK